MLKQVIEKAIEGGWEERRPDSAGTGILKYEGIEAYHCILFNHDFAKAFFGELIRKRVKLQRIAGDGTRYVGYLKAPAWQHHLQQAVLAEDPLEYYFKHLIKPLDET